MTNENAEPTTSEAVEEPKTAEATPEAEQMCCDGNRTAAEHRHESADGKCCSD